MNSSDKKTENVVKIQKKKNGSFAPILFGTIIVLIILCTISVRIYYDYLQYAEIGLKYVYIFFTNTSMKLAVQVISFILVFIYFLINNICMRKILFKENDDLKVITSKVMLVIITIIIAFLASNVISQNVYSNFLTFLNNEKFNQTDPIFNMDLSYYIFERPFYMEVVDSVKGVLLFNTLYSFMVYLLLRLRNGITHVKAIFKTRGVLVHCLVNVMMYIVAVALTYRFTREEILFGSFCGVSGAGFTDVKIWGLYYNIAPLFLLIIVPLAVYFIKKMKYTRAVAAVTVFPLMWVLTYAAATITQTVAVESDELAIEQKYIQYNIDMTRNAYDLNSISQQQAEISNNLAYKDIINDSKVLPNVISVDTDEYIKQVNSVQGFGNYYKFNDVDLVPYTIDENSTLAAVSVRELDNEKLSHTTDSYVNNTFKYTHSMGVTVSDVRSGKDKYIVKDIPSLSNVGFPRIKQPRIYYGEKMNNAVVVNTNYDEVDYMNTQQSAYSYEGFGGIQMTPLNRAVMAVCGRDYQMLFSNQITLQSRALLNRNVVERVKKIAPFFSYDSDPYMVITDDGELVWVLDVYTVTNQYPYSTKVGNVNYIRCPAKAVVDAYNGTVSFYITDKDNPFIKTYANIYPTLFETDEIPDSIVSHLRYPKDIFKIRAEVYKTYHVTDAASFYDKNDVWEFAKEKSKKGDTQSVPFYYNVTDKGVTLNAVYISHNGKNINGILAVGSDAENYGNIFITKLSETGEITTDTMYAEKLMEEDSAVIEQLRQLAENGSQVTIGNLEVIPIGNSLIYISPVYAVNANNTSAYPELKKVIVVYNDKVAIENDILEGLKVIFGKKTADPHEEEFIDNEGIKELINSIIDMYSGVRQYNTAGDWENYGKAMSEFDKSMAELEQRRHELDTIKPFVGPLEEYNARR